MLLKSSYLANQMAKLKIYYNLALISKGKLAKDTLKAFIKSNGTPTFISTVFCTSIFISTQALAPVLIFIYILYPLRLYTDVHLQKAIRLALKSFI